MEATAAITIKLNLTIRYLYNEYVRVGSSNDGTHRKRCIFAWKCTHLDLKLQDHRVYLAHITPPDI